MIYYKLNFLNSYCNYNYTYLTKLATSAYSITVKVEESFKIKSLFPTIGLWSKTKLNARSCSVSVGVGEGVEVFIL